MFRAAIFTVFLIIYSASDAANSGANCPTRFDDFVVANGAIVPYPFEKFVKYEQDLTGGEPLGTLIPDGRSLQRRKANFEDPRHVAIFTAPSARNKKLSVSPNEQIFVGYAPKANQLEVISWSPCKRRFEFQVVENYKQSGAARVVTPERAACIQCHQAEAPIFSQSPWRETTSEANPDLRRTVEKFRKEGRREFLGLTKGGPAFSDLATVTDIDKAVRDANQFLRDSMACEQICGLDLECRKYLLASAILNPLGLQPNEVSSKILDISTIQKVFEKKLAKDGFAYPSSVLPDRDPMSEIDGKKTGFKTVIPARFREIARGHLRDKEWVVKPNVSGAPQFPNDFHAGNPDEWGTGAYAYEQALGLSHGDTETTYLEELSAANFTLFDIPSRQVLGERRSLELSILFPAIPGSVADPTVARPKVSAIPKQFVGQWAFTRAFACLGFEQIDQEILDSIPFNDREKVLNTSVFDALLSGSWPADRVAVMRTLFKALNLSEIPACYGTQAKTEPVEKDRVQSIQKVVDSLGNTPHIDSQSNLFRKYCASCHAGSDAIATELPIDDIKGLKQFQSKGHTPLKMLSTGKMPPEKALQPTLVEKEEMLNELR